MRDGGRFRFDVFLSDRANRKYQTRGEREHGNDVLASVLALIGVTDNRFLKNVLTSQQSSVDHVLLLNKAPLE